MPILKTIASHDQCSTYIQKYLEHGNKNDKDRALAKDFLNIAPWDQKNWAQVMDETREEAGLVGSYKGKKRRTYDHIIVSPDPKDAIGINDLRTLATTYARTLFGDMCENKNGLFGLAQVAIIYHNDNKNHIPHAHLIVNHIDLNTDKALHFDNKNNKTTLPDTLQSIAQEMSLSYFDNSVTEDYPKENNISTVPPETETRTPYLTKTERGLNKNRKFSWKEYIREAVAVAARTTTTEAGFLDELTTLGVTAKLAKRDEHGKADYIYSMEQNPTRWRCTGYRLGKSYTREAVTMTQSKNLQRKAEHIDDIRNRINNYINEEIGRIKKANSDTKPDKEIPSTRSKEFRTEIYVPKSMPLFQVSEVLYLREMLDCESAEDFKNWVTKAQDLSQRQLAKGDIEQAQKTKRTVERIRAVIPYVNQVIVIPEKSSKTEVKPDNPKKKTWIPKDGYGDPNYIYGWRHNPETGELERYRKRNTYQHRHHSSGSSSRGGYSPPLRGRSR